MNTSLVQLAVEFDPDGIIEGSAGLSSASPVDTTINIIGVVLGLLGIIFLILVIAGGFMWMTSAGNEDKIKKAKGLLIAAIIGLALVLGAYGISEWVFNTLYTATG